MGGPARCYSFTGSRPTQRRRHGRKKCVANCNSELSREGARVLVSSSALSRWLKLTKARSYAAVKLGKLLFPLFALALDLPETFFDDKVLLLRIVFVHIDSDKNDNGRPSVPLH